MSSAHPTVEPAQVKSDTFSVFHNRVMRSGVERPVLLGHIDVPRYSQPNSNGVRLSRDKRLALAVYRVVTEETVLSDGEFLVMDQVGEMESVEYRENPAFDAVWDPEEGL